MPSFTFEQVRKHCKPDDIWIVLHNKAREQLELFYVGDLPTEEHAESIEVYRPNFEHVSQSAAVDVEKSTSWSSVSPRQGLSHNGSSSHFWTGVGIASVVQGTLTLGLGMWISTKLDVQQEFTHHVPRRQTKPQRIIRLPRSNLPIKNQIVEVAPRVYRFVFALPNPDDILGLPTGQHIALRAAINGQSVSRSYTLVSNNSDLGRIELLVKIYPNGAMTQHLEQMKVGDSIEIRGPKGAMQYSRQYAPHIGMIAGGTGITPMYQLIRATCEDDGDKSQVSLLYANNTAEDTLLRKELDEFARNHSDKFRVHTPMITTRDNPPIAVARIPPSGGYKVHIRDPSPQALSDASAYIDSYREDFTALTPFQPTSGSLETFTEIAVAVSDAWLVVEAVPEKLPLKISTFADVDRHASLDCIIESNSSSIQVEAHAGRGETGKKSVLIFNRLWAAIKREIMSILAEDVSSPEEIDLLWQNMFQLPSSLPPCRLMGQIGLDTVALIEDNYIQERTGKPHDCRLAARGVHNAWKIGP
ncbi:hypothetical protein BBP40_007304 [Aspergillus hancockii]|nr:hypothetical protein BBP40_007304 [Aspergillus hancockii]